MQVNINSSYVSLRCISYLYSMPYVEQVQSDELVCQLCGKKYKTKGGLQRHTKAKHGQNQDEDQQRLLSPSILAEIVSSALLKVTNTKVFSASIRNELSLYTFQQPEEQDFTKLKKIYDGLVKNSDAEKFYGKFYGTIPLVSTRFFKGLSQTSATLLSTKVADCMLAFCKKEKSAAYNNKESTVALSEREKAGLQYIGGYVLHNLHNKHSGRKTTESQQAIAILKAGKLETGTESQKLVSTLNRGGLWSITEPAQNIFFKTEHYFRLYTSESGLQKIDLASITHKSITDCDVLSNYHLLLSAAELPSEIHVSKDILQSIVNMYVRVRSFSFAKDIIQRHKIKAKQTKSKSLRKEINRSCQVEQVQRQE